MFLLVSVILFTGGVPDIPPRSRHTSLGADTPHPTQIRYTPKQTPTLGSKHPRTRYTPPEQTLPGTRYTPQSRHLPLGPGTPPWDQVHPPWTRYTPQDQVHPLGPGTPSGTSYTPSPGPARPPGSRHPPGADTPLPPEQTPPSAEHAGRYGQHAGGTHPTGMQSCWKLC